HSPLTSSLFPYTTLFRSRSTISIKPVVHFVRHLITGFKVVDYIFHITPRRTHGSSGHLRFELFVLHHISQSFLSALNRCNLKPVDRKSTRLNSSHVSISY